MLPLTTIYQNPKPYKAVITSSVYVLMDNSTAWQAPHYLVTIPQGFSNAQRIGKQVRVFYIDFVYNFECQGTFAKGGSGRIVIVYDKQNNSSSIQAVDVFNQNSFFQIKELIPPTVSLSYMIKLSLLSLLPVILILLVSLDSLLIMIFSILDLMDLIPLLVLSFSSSHRLVLFLVIPD